MTDAGNSEISNTKSPRKMIIVAAIAVAVVVVIVVICLGILPNSLPKNSSIAGVYDAKPPLAGSYMELRADGTLYLYSQYGYGYSGTWEFKGSNRIYVKSDYGMAAYFTLEGNTLTQEGTGYKYVKR